MEIRVRIYAGGMVSPRALYQRTKKLVANMAHVVICILSVLDRPVFSSYGRYRKGQRNQVPLSPELSRNYQLAMDMRSDEFHFGSNFRGILFS